MYKRTGFDVYFIIFNIKTHGVAYGSRSVGIEVWLWVSVCLQSTYTLAKLNNMW